MKIVIGSDHAGFPVKERIRRLLEKEHEIKDLGTFSEESCDYPDFALLVAEAVAAGQAERGILICGTGIGMSIAANKVKGIRAALCIDEQTARLSRLHNNANVICLGARTCEPKTLEKLVTVWLASSFEGKRHNTRLKKIEAMENK